MPTPIAALFAYVIGGLIVGIIAGYMIRKNLAEAKIKTAEEAAAKILVDAKREAEAKTKETILEAKDEVLRLRMEADREIKERRSDVTRLEKRLQQKEEHLDRKTDSIEKRDENIRKKEKEIEERRQKITELQEQKLHDLEVISGVTSQEAKQMLLSSIEDEVKHRNPGQGGGRGPRAGNRRLGHPAGGRRPCGGNYGFRCGIAE